MRKRLGSPTIRLRITTLVLVPIVALVALWSFAMVSMTGDLRALIRLQDVYGFFGTPVDNAAAQIQVERRTAAEYLGSGGGSAELAAYTAQQRLTDDAVRAMRAAATDPGRQGDLTGEQRDRLNEMLRAADGLTALRQEVYGRQTGWSQAVDGYTAVVEPQFAVESALSALQAGRLAREAQVVIELVREQEFISREDAIGAGARAAGSFTPAQYSAFAAAVEDRRVFQRTYVPALPADSRALFDTFGRDPRYTALVQAEDTVLAAGPADGARSIRRDAWRATLDPVEHRFDELTTDAAVNSAERGRAYATDQLVRAGLAGGAGLAALVFSVWYSVRTGRWLKRRLLRLQAAAHLLARSQLPQVVRRLRDGEPVDVDTEAPQLSFGTDEIGDVGRALNHARRAVVEAAVEQARLRRGVSAVYLNIARRSQALIHRQLKLLDAMERRATDPDELADLFRLDHLATRMRRHAEGLVILSGAAPGRMWSRPVPLVDVVGSAVGAVEEYQRVEIPPMPRIAVVGSAVADLAHLVAELVENGTSFSPPQTQVTVRAGEVVNGFALEVDDRGLGMDPDELAEANRHLSEPWELDPTRTERLGLFVVGRLARRHGIEVTLRRSPYGGITAVVLLPRAILAAQEPEPAPERAPEAGPAAAAEPVTLTVVPERPDSSVLPLRKRSPARAGGLPTRVRPGEQRAADEPGPAAEDTAAVPAGPSAEELGAVFGAFQRGLNRGRGARDHDEEGEE